MKNDKSDKDIEVFRQQAHQLVDWMAGYFRDIEKYPVKSKVKPGEVYDLLPPSPPENSEDFRTIMDDFNRIIMPGITHWQHPSFHAYFNANNSFPSILGEMLTATLGAQCMIWDTSPAAAELEELVMNWLKQMMELPSEWHGVIQDTASTSTLVALLTARERISGFRVNKEGFAGQKRMTWYCSEEAHSSIEKAVKIAGFGSENLRKIAVDESFAMIPEKLEERILKDMEGGFEPVGVIAAAGTTSTLAVDPLRPIGEICRKYNLWYHIDAAYAGNTALLPEKRRLLDGLELADSYVFNPHKWMFTNFDLSAYFVRDKEALIRTFEILPEYLKTRSAGQTNNYRDWGIQLGRRFRALKLWFVIRTYGVSGIRETFRKHIALAEDFKNFLEKDGRFEIMAPVRFNLVCFRYRPANTSDEQKINELNKAILEAINDTGKAYITHTKLNGKYTLRFVAGQTRVEKKHIDQFIELLNAVIKQPELKK